MHQAFLRAPLRRVDGSGEAVGGNDEEKLVLESVEFADNECFVFGTEVESLLHKVVKPVYVAVDLFEKFGFDGVADRHVGPL
jgi:hypothetical protein